MTASPQPGSQDERHGPWCNGYLVGSCACTRRAVAASGETGAGGEADDGGPRCYSTGTGCCERPDACAVAPLRQPAPSAGQDTETSRDPAPSVKTRPDTSRRPDNAGQDTERLRDEVARVLADQTVTVIGYNVRTPMTAEGIVGLESARIAARALLDGPLRQLIAERDKARAQVQRVETILTTWPQFHAKCECGPDHLMRELRRALGPS